MDAKTVIYIVTSDKREETQTLLNQQLSNAGFNVSKVFVGKYQIVKNLQSILLPSGAQDALDLNHRRVQCKTQFSW